MHKGHVGAMVKCLRDPSVGMWGAVPCMANWGTAVLPQNKVPASLGSGSQRSLQT